MDHNYYGEKRPIPVFRIHSGPCEFDADQLGPSLNGINSDQWKLLTVTVAIVTVTETPV